MKKLFTLIFAVSLGMAAFAADITIDENITGLSDPTLSNAALPIRLNGGSSAAKYSISQQIYQASELIEAGASAGYISAITFYYNHADNTTCTRDIQVWIMETNLDIFPMTVDDPGKFVCNSSYKAGVKVFDNSVTLQKDDYTITFEENFYWGGTKNLLLTVFDNTGTNSTNNRHVILKTGTGNTRFINKACITTPLSGWDINDLYNTPAGSFKSSSSEITGHQWVNKITFTFENSSAPSTPSDLAVSATTSTSATLSWSAVSGATSYDLQQSADGSAWTTLASGETGTSYNWTGLSVASTQYARIRAVNAAGNSDWSDAVTVATDAVHSHDGITFTKWSSTNSMPLSGSYYLANDVTITAVVAQELSGDLNLCLNGHTLAFTAASGCIQIGSSETLAIYDAEGNGLITSPNGTATIQVASNGTLAIHGGNVENSGGGNPITKDGSVSFDLLENVSNTSMIALASGVGNISIHMDRSFTSSQFNTICLPFTLYSDKLSSIFGYGYDLEEFVSSELSGEELVLNFTEVTQLDGGKPYLIKPAHNVVNPTFSGVDISALSPIDNTSDPYISFHGVFSPTELEGGNKNLLFLGANDELFWPAATGDLKGFRAYFEVKGDARKVAKRASIVRNPGSATGISNQPSEIKHHKYIKDGLLVIERDGKLYNAQGQMIK